MLTSIELQNWRCTEDLDTPLEPLTALVGPNGAGKSAVLRAIDFVLSTRWPSMDRLDVPRDFYAQDTTRDLRIACTFDPPLKYPDVMKNIHQVVTLEFRCQPYKVSRGEAEVGDLRDEFRPLTAEGELPTVAVRGPRKGQQPLFEPLLRPNGASPTNARQGGKGSTSSGFRLNS
jgi:hypothetical protein